jgi:Cft2 family RNA processing exonuclease
MRFINLTRLTEIGANSYFLELDGKKLILDAGLHPTNEGEAALPLYRLVPDGSIDAILISHAHQDHIGTLPVLMRRQPQAKVFMTQPTARLADAMLHNSVNVMSRQRGEPETASYPLFTHREADQARERWQTVGLRQYCSFDGERLPEPDSEPTFEFYDAGHILGSAGMFLRGEGKKIFYTGDVNFLDQTLMSKAAFPEEELDVLIIETTRGDRALEAGYSRVREQQRLIAAIEEAFEKGGSVLVPVFALGKTQEILTIFDLYKRQGRLRDIPIYIGGLSTKITLIHDELASVSTRQQPGLRLLESLEPFVLRGDDVPTTQIHRRRIFALSSGMMTEKTLSNQLAERFLDDPKQSIYFVGYSDPESPAGRIRASRTGDLVQLDQELPAKKIVSTIRDFDFSAHAPRELLLNYIRNVSPKIVVLVHGDSAAVNWFKARIETELPRTQTVVPDPGRQYEF